MTVEWVIKCAQCGADIYLPRLPYTDILCPKCNRGASDAKKTGLRAEGGGLSGINNGRHVARNGQDIPGSIVNHGAGRSNLGLASENRPLGGAGDFGNKESIPRKIFSQLSSPKNGDTGEPDGLCGQPHHDSNESGKAIKAPDANPVPGPVDRREGRRNVNQPSERDHQIGSNARIRPRTPPVGNDSPRDWRYRQGSGSSQGQRLSKSGYAPRGVRAIGNPPIHNRNQTPSIRASEPNSPSPLAEKHNLYASRTPQSGSKAWPSSWRGVNHPRHAPDIRAGPIQKGYPPRGNIQIARPRQNRNHNPISGPRHGRHEDRPTDFICQLVHPEGHRQRVGPTERHNGEIPTLADPEKVHLNAYYDQIAAELSQEERSGLDFQEALEGGILDDHLTLTFDLHGGRVP